MPDHAIIIYIYMRHGYTAIISFFGNANTCDLHTVAQTIQVDIGICIRELTNYFYLCHHRLHRFLQSQISYQQY
jgi:hypothetical protein